MIACSGIAEKHSAKDEDIIQVLLVRSLLQKVDSDPKTMECYGRKLETAYHAMDVAFSVGGGLIYSEEVVRAGGGIVLTALIVAQQLREEQKQLFIVPIWLVYRKRL